MTNSSKSTLRSALRKARRDYVASLPTSISALLFKAPPRPLLSMIPQQATIGLYCATDGEAPTSAYAKHFMEHGHQIALPHLASEDGPMQFRGHTDPFARSDLEHGPFGLLQPGDDAASCTPDVLFVPLIGFAADGRRLGQGGGFYDRWLAAHPQTLAIGLAWDMQLVDELPVEDHDMPLAAIVTPTRIYGSF